jgi:hypothetical protein
VSGPPGDRGLAWRRLRPAGAADARDHRDRPAGGARGAAQLSGSGLPASPPQQRGQGAALGRARGAAPSRSTSPPCRRRASSSPARWPTAWLGHLLSCPSTPGVFFEPAGAARTAGARGAQAGRPRPPGGRHRAFGDDVDSPHRRAAGLGRPSRWAPWAQARHNLLQRTLFAAPCYVDVAAEVQRLWLAGLIATRRCRACPTSSCSRPTSSAQSPWCRARLSRLPGYRHHHSARRARRADSRRTQLRHPRPPHRARAPGGKEPRAPAAGRSR